MRRKKIISFCSVLTFFVINTKGVSQSLFQKTYGNVNEDYGRDIFPTSDSGFYVTGGTNSFATNTNLYLFKIDKNGNLIWSNNIGGANIDWGISVIETNDGGSATLGYTNSFGAGGYDFYLVKSDLLGNILWQKTFGGSDWDFGYTITEDSDGNLYLAGETYSFGNGNNDGYIIKTDSNGEIIWEKTFGTNLFEKISKIIILNNGTISYASTQEIDSQGNSGDFIVGNIDANGNEIWQKTFSYSTDDEISDIIQSYDNNLIYVGTMNPGIIGFKDFYFEKISLINGDVIWSNSQGLSDGDDIAKGIIELENNDLVVSGTSFPGTFGNGDFVNRRTDSFGFLVSGYTSMGYFEKDILYGITKTLSKGYAVVGESNSFESDLNYQVLVCIIDSNNQNIDYTGVINVIDNFSNTVTSAKNYNKPTISIYPNPFSSTIQINANQNQIDQIIIKDVLGNLVLNAKIEPQQILNVNYLTCGYYLIEVKNKNSVVFRSKIVKSN